jgi:hypothetical protein
MKHFCTEVVWQKWNGVKVCYFFVYLMNDIVLQSYKCLQRNSRKSFLHVLAVTPVMQQNQSFVSMQFVAAKREGWPLIAYNICVVLYRCL